MATSASAGGDEKLRRSFQKLIKTRLLKKNQEKNIPQRQSYFQDTNLFGEEGKNDCELCSPALVQLDQTTDGKGRQLSRQLLLRNGCAGGGDGLFPSPHPF